MPNTDAPAGLLTGQDDFTLPCCDGEKQYCALCDVAESFRTLGDLISRNFHLNLADNQPPVSLYDRSGVHKNVAHIIVDVNDSHQILLSLSHLQVFCKLAKILAWLHCFDVTSKYVHFFAGMSRVGVEVCLHGQALSLGNQLRSLGGSSDVCLSVSVHALHAVCRGVNVHSNGSGNV